MAKVKPNLRSDEDSAVELSKSASDSDQSPRPDLFSAMELRLPTYYLSDSEYSDDDDVSSSAVSSSTYQASLTLTSSGKSASPGEIPKNFENPRRSARKGRKRSIEDDENLLEQELSRTSYKHQSKNAINARINRIKKKKYMQSLEDSLDAYKSECRKWQVEYRQKVHEVSELQNEVEYLKSVIRNETRLGKLVKSFTQRVNVDQSPTKADSGYFLQNINDKGTKLSCTSNKQFIVGSNNFNDILQSGIPDINMNDISKIEDFLNCDSASLGSNNSLICNEDITFESVFPSACDLFNSDLPEMDEESTLFTPELPYAPTDALETVSSLHDDVGICLHVSANNGISMEFCSHCSKSTLGEVLNVSLST